MSFKNKKCQLPNVCFNLNAKNAMKQQAQPIRKISKAPPPLDLTKISQPMQMAQQLEQTPNSALQQTPVSVSPQSSTSPPLVFQPDASMTYWAKTLQWLFFPSKENAFSNLLNRILVVPLTNLTPFSMQYQVYLCEIFHTNFYTKISHLYNIPVHLFLVMVFLNQFNNNDGTQFWCINGGLIYALALQCYYVIWGLVSGLYLFGFWPCVPMFMLWVLSTLTYQLYGNPYNPWHSPMNSLWMQPWLLLAVSAFMQSVGHGFEDYLPPRVSNEDSWVRFRYYIWGTKRHPLTWYQTIGRLVLITIQSVFGTVDEFMACERLFPVFLLRLMFGIGYAPAYWRGIQQVVRISCSGSRYNPAIDFMGKKGTKISKTVYYEKDAFVEILCKKMRTSVPAILAPSHLVAKPINNAQ